ncbi:unnamed protein product, partial [marine sediment metagenome]
FDSQRNEKTGHLSHPLFSGNSRDYSPVSLTAFFKKLKN